MKCSTCYGSAAKRGNVTWAFGAAFGRDSQILTTSRSSNQSELEEVLEDLATSGLTLYL